jgi:hypothetical protein
LFLLDHGQVHASTRSAHGAREVAGELLLQLVPLVDRVLVQRLDGEGVAPEPLDGILLRVVLGDPQRFELVGEEQVAKPR